MLLYIYKYIYIVKYMINIKKYNNISEITTDGTNGTIQEAVSNFLTAHIIDTDKQTTKDINDRQNNVIDNDRAELLAEECIDFIVSQDSDKVNQNLISTMNYICANLDSASIALFLKQISTIFNHLGDDNPFDVDAIKKYLTDTPRQAYGSLGGHLTAHNVYGSEEHRQYYAECLGKNYAIDMKNALNAKTTDDIYTNLKTIEETEGGGEMEGVTSHCLKDFLIQKFGIDILDNETVKEIFNGLEDTIVNDDALKAVLTLFEEIEDIDVFDDIAPIMMINNEADVSKYVKMEDYNTTGNRNEFIKKFINDNNLFVDWQPQEKNPVDLQKIIIAIMDQIGISDGVNPSELLGNYIGAVVDVLKEKNSQLAEQLNTEVYTQFGRYAGAYNQSGNEADFVSVIDVANLENDSLNAFKQGLSQSDTLRDKDSGNGEVYTSWGKAGTFQATGIDYEDHKSRWDKFKDTMKTVGSITKSVLIGDSPKEIALNMGLLLAGVLTGGAVLVAKVAVTAAKVAKVANAAKKINKVADTVATTQEVVDKGKAIVDLSKGDATALLDLAGLPGGKQTNKKLDLSGLPGGKQTNKKLDTIPEETDKDIEDELDSPTADKEKTGAESLETVDPKEAKADEEIAKNSTKEKNVQSQQKKENNIADELDSSPTNEETKIGNDEKLSDSTKSKTNSETLDKMAGSVDNIIKQIEKKGTASIEQLNACIKLAKKQLEDIFPKSLCNKIINTLNAAVKEGGKVLGDTLDNFKTFIKTASEKLSPNQKEYDGAEISSTEYTEWLDDMEINFGVSPQSGEKKGYEKQEDWDKEFNKTPENTSGKTNKPAWLNDIDNPFKSELNNNNLTSPKPNTETPASTSKPSYFDKILEMQKPEEKLNTQQGTQNTIDDYSTDWLTTTTASELNRPTPLYTTSIESVLRKSQQQAFNNFLKNLLKNDKGGDI